MKRFHVIDKKTKIYPDIEQIVTTEKWAKGMIYRETDTFALTENGNLILLDERGYYAVCPSDRLNAFVKPSNTGVCDKDGEWICLDDIVELDGEPYYVAYSEGAFMICNKYHMYWHNLRDVYPLLKVIGNMRDNPEQLKK